MRYLIQITLPYACAGIEIDAPNPYGRVIRTAPIFNWMLGKHLQDIEMWLARKGATWQYVKQEEE